MRLVCRRLGHVASSITDRHIRYPIADLDLMDIRARARAIKVLACADSLSAVSRVTVSGVNKAKRKDYEAREQISEAHVAVLSGVLDASNLKHVTARTDWRMTRSLLKELAQWPKVQSLDVLVSGEASCLAFGRIQTLTLRLLPHCSDRDGLVHTIPALPQLSRLKLESVWPPGEWRRPVLTRFDFGRYPKLTVLKLCGEAGGYYMNMFTGNTTSIKRCIIGDERELGVNLGLQLTTSEASTFFSRFSGGLEALTLNFGAFGHISSSFPRLRSLKLVYTNYTRANPMISINSCPITQLSLVSHGNEHYLSGSIAILVPLFAATLQRVQLVQDPTKEFGNPLRVIPFMGPVATNELMLCKNLKYLEISGLLVLDEYMRAFGRGNTNVQGVMMTFPTSCNYHSRFVAYPGLQRARAPEGHVKFAKRVTHIQVRDLSPYWNDCGCPCGWRQRRQFAQHIDPENMFSDDEDDFQSYDKHILETKLGPDDPTTHIEEDKAIRMEAMAAETSPGHLCCICNRPSNPSLL